jgi:hypothetical protein
MLIVSIIASSRSGSAGVESTTSSTSLEPSPVDAVELDAVELDAVELDAVDRATAVESCSGTPAASAAPMASSPAIKRRAYS